MRVFGRQEKVLPESQVRLAERVAGKILLGQQKAADYLNIRTAGISTKQWRVMLVAFCLLFGGYSLYLLIEAIY
jgi:hypothetical protein